MRDITSTADTRRGGFVRPPITLLLLGFIALAGLTFRAYRLSARSLWFDEAWSWRMTQFPFPDLIEHTTHDVHPPLYYILLTCWTALFGDSEIALRSLSVIFGSLTIIGMYLFANEAFRRRPSANNSLAKIDLNNHWLALFIAALVALSALQVRYSWEVRMYTLGTALAAFSSWALFRALYSPVSLGRWLMFAGLAVLFAYTHYYAFFSLAGQAVFVLGYLLVLARWNVGSMLYSRQVWYAALAAGLVLLAILPWFPIFLEQTNQVQAAFWIKPVKGWNVAFAYWEMFVEPENAIFSKSKALVAAGLSIVALLALCWKARAGEWYVLLMAVLPVGLSILASLLGTQVFHVRYLLFAHLFLLAGLGLLVWRLPFATEKGLVAGVVLANSVAIYLLFWQNLDITAKPGTRAAAALIASNWQPGDLVVVRAPQDFFPLRYYVQEQVELKLYRQQAILHYHGAIFLDPDNFISPEEVEASSAARVWVVDVKDASWGYPPMLVPPHWDRIEEQQFPEVLRCQGMILVAEYSNGHGTGGQNSKAEVTPR